MKSLFCGITIGLFTCTAILPFTAHTVYAEGSPYRASLTQTSLRQALGERAVPLLEVAPPKEGRDGQFARLLRLLEASRDRRIHARNPGKPQSSDRSTILFATDNSWYLQVIGDGSRFLYRGNIDDPKELEATARFGQLDMGTLERLGREYITKQLASLVAIPRGEALVFLGTKYLRQGSAAEDNQQFTSEVVANIAIFGREVHDTFVAGPGSKIAVWFSNSGEPVGFDVDWPTYQTSQDIQATLPISQMWERLFTYADSPRELIERNTTRFECGYVDLGVYKRQGNVIQTGCFAHHDGSLPDGDLKYASIETIPLGVQVVEDSSWPVTKLIAARQEPPSGDAEDLGGPDTTPR